MNRKQIIILMSALAVSALIVWHDLPITFPWIMAKVLLLFMKVSVILALAVVACILAGGKKKIS
ncbi:MAG: hypothetical protein A4E62_02993 [Syntrophorhabdus sp. PtaU1.Bin002]|nr:MAG: hypothetical protein A4E58_03177 [Syntrophorhabdus sp. PtaB.Bin006]OPY62572.1 MAG: hypothetical protein A4E62_02993 [Syntrophorhabdus sp. PtaU1.Bin002]